MATLIYIFLATWPLYSERNIVDFGPGVPAIDILRPFTLLLLFMTFFGLLVNKRKLVTGKVVLTGVLFITYFLLNLFMKEPGSGIVSAIVDLFQRFLLPLSIYFVLMNNREKLNPRLVIYAVLVSGVYIVGVGFLEFIAGRNVIGNVGFVDISSKLYRTNGPFGDGIGFAGIALTLVPFSYYALKKRMANRSFALFCIIFFSIGCLINYTRVIWLGLFVVLVIMFMVNTVRGVLLSSYFLILASIVTYLSFDTIASSSLFKKRFADTTNIKTRYNQYTDAISLFIKNPVFGMGYETYVKTHSLALHNSYLRTLVEFGSIGLITFCLYVWTMVLKGFKKTLISDGIYGLKARLSLIIIVLLIPNTIDFLYNANFQLLLAIIIFILTPISEPRQATLHKS